MEAESTRIPAHKVMAVSDVFAYFEAGTGKCLGWRYNPITCFINSA